MEFYTEFPGKIRGKKRRRKRSVNYKPHNSSNLLGKSLKIEYEREQRRAKFLDSKEWMSLNKRERKNVRALFRDQRSLSTQFLEQVTNVTNVANMEIPLTAAASRAFARVPLKYSTSSTSSRTRSD